jgi:hypothetical protein
MRLRFELLFQCGYQSRFADARLSREQDHAAFTPQSLVPAAYEQLLLFTPYQRSKAGLVLRLEPALHRARGEYLPCLDRLGQALEHHSSEIAVFEEPASQPSCARRDHHLTGLRKRL